MPSPTSRNVTTPTTASPPRAGRAPGSPSHDGRGEHEQREDVGGAGDAVQHHLVHAAHGQPGRRLDRPRRGVGLQVERPGRPDERDGQQPDRPGPHRRSAQPGAEQHAGEHQVQRAEPVVEHGLAQRLARRGGGGDGPGPRLPAAAAAADGPRHRGPVLRGGRDGTQQRASRPRPRCRARAGRRRRHGRRARPRRRRGSRDRSGTDRRHGRPSRRRSRTRSDLDERLQPVRQPGHDRDPRRVLGDLDVAAERGEPLDVARQLARAARPPSPARAPGRRRAPTAARRGARGARAARCGRGGRRGASRPRPRGSRCPTPPPRPAAPRPRRSAAPTGAGRRSPRRARRPAPGRAAPPGRRRGRSPGTGPAARPARPAPGPARRSRRRSAGRRGVGPHAGRRGAVERAVQRVEPVRRRVRQLADQPPPLDLARPGQPPPRLAQLRRQLVGLAHPLVQLDAGAARCAAAARRRPRRPA